MSRFAVVLLCGVLLVVAGCTSGASSPLASTSAREHTLASIRPSESASAATAGLRGFTVRSLTCPSTRPTSTSTQPVRITGDVRAYRICPPLLGDPPTPRGAPTVVTATKDPATLDALSAALAVPDVAPNTSQEPCAANADLPVVILAETTDGDWSAHVPTDQCGHYFRATAQCPGSVRTVGRPGRASALEGNRYGAGPRPGIGEPVRQPEAGRVRGHRVAS